MSAQLWAWTIVNIEQQWTTITQPRKIRNRSSSFKSEEESCQIHCVGREALWHQQSKESIFSIQSRIEINVAENFANTSHNSDKSFF